MGRVPSDGKIPDDMSAEGKCTVEYYYSVVVVRYAHVDVLVPHRYSCVTVYNLYSSGYSTLKSNAAILIRLNGRHANYE